MPVFCLDIWTAKTSETSEAPRFSQAFLEHKAAHTWGWHSIKRTNLPIKHQIGKQFVVCNKLHSWKTEFLGPVTVSTTEEQVKRFLKTEVCQTDGCNNLFAASVNYLAGAFKDELQRISINNAKLFLTVVMIATFNMSFFTGRPGSALQKVCNMTNTATRSTTNWKTAHVSPPPASLSLVLDSLYQFSNIPQHYVPHTSSLALRIQCPKWHTQVFACPVKSVPYFEIRKTQPKKTTNKNNPKLSWNVEVEVDRGSAHTNKNVWMWIRLV